MANRKPTHAERMRALRDSARNAAPKYDSKAGKLPGRLFGSRGPHVTSGPVGRDSAGYSVLKAAALASGAIPPDRCKEEVEVHNRLKGLYANYSGWASGFRSLLVPTATDLLPVAYGPDTLDPDPEKVRFRSELRQKMLAGMAGADPDEAQWLVRKGVVRKALGTLDLTAGGSLVAPPVLGEVIELQRNREVFVNAGAQEIALPPNGRIQFPKLSGGSTAYMVGESLPATASEPKTGVLTLEAKKLAVLVPVNSELFKFANPTAEAIVRDDMAKQAALKADSEMLHGTGGVGIKGLLTYDGTTAWSQGVDRLIVHTASTVGTNGDTFEPEDIALMEGKLPDPVQAPTAWVMHRRFFSVVSNRRADAVTAGDKKGPFVFDMMRELGEARSPNIYGTKVVTSAQVSTSRVKGSGTNLTYVLLGYFPDWIIARFGVMELLANPWGDTAFTNDQVFLRGIQHLDAGPRHPASFVLCDQLIVA